MYTLCDFFWNQLFKPQSSRLPSCLICGRQDRSKPIFSYPIYGIIVSQYFRKMDRNFLKTGSLGRFIRIYPIIYIHKKQSCPIFVLSSPDKLTFKIFNKALHVSQSGLSIYHGLPPLSRQVKITYTSCLSFCFFSVFYITRYARLNAP